MNFLEERIVKDGIVKEGNVLKVDSFLNHQMDIELFDQMGAEFKKRFADRPINKILTIEASGIGIACVVAQHFGVPVVFAKKTKSINIEGEMYTAEVESFTHKCKNQVIVAKKFLSEDDHVLIIDDFLANGCALQGLIQIVKAAGGTVEGIGIAIEKGFHTGCYSDCFFQLTVIKLQAKNASFILRFLCSAPTLIIANKQVAFFIKSNPHRRSPTGFFQYRNIEPLRYLAIFSDTHQTSRLCNICKVRTSQN